MKIIIGIPRKVPLILGNPYRRGVSGNCKSAEDLVGLVLRNSCAAKSGGGFGLSVGGLALVGSVLKLRV